MPLTLWAITAGRPARWAMTIAPIAGVVLREHIGPRRVVCACIIAAGAAILRLA